jgi:hypothetical protein
VANYVVLVLQSFVEDSDCDCHLQSFARDSRGNTAFDENISGEPRRRFSDLCGEILQLSPQEFKGIDISVRGVQGMIEVAGQECGPAP